MNGLSLDIAVILGPLLAVYLIFDQWASHQERRARAQRARLRTSARRGSVGDAAVTSTAPALPRGDLVRSPDYKDFRTMPGQPHRRVDGQPHHRVYDWDLDQEDLTVLAGHAPRDAIAILDQLDEIRRLPETEEPER